jgi:hypothetical protein
VTSVPHGKSTRRNSGTGPHETGRGIASRPNKRLVQGLLALLVAIVAGVSQMIGSGGDASSSSARQSDGSAAAAAPAQQSAISGDGTAESSDEVDRSVGFKSAAQLDSHYAKHRREFGSISKAEYLSQAQELRDAPLSDTIIEAWQARGNWSRFDRDSGSFIAFRNDRVILTFFRPDDGEAYFRRAAGRTP